jgi:ABC-type oligopeptide transport system substrate-binding subunit
MFSGMRKTFSLLALAAGCGLLAASALASVNQAPPANTFRWSLSVDIDYVDPALAYYRPTWALEYATGAMLFNYPDAPAPRGSRLVPEVAAAFPTVSRDGKTYTFRLKRTFRFSNGTRVTARSFAWALNRGLQRRVAAPAQPFLEDIVGARDVVSGRTAKARGVLVPAEYTLQLRLTRPATDLLARLAMPFFMAIPPSLDANPEGISAPVVSAGPYFIREWRRNRRIVLERNRFYRGPRPRNVRRIEVDVGLPLETIKLNIDRGSTDAGDIPPSAHAELGRRFGVRRRSPGRYFANPIGSIRYLAMNHDRRLFGGPTPLGNVRLKKAVNFAIDRRGILHQYGAFAGIVNDQILPPTIRGFRDVAIYPRRPNLARARALATGSLRPDLQGSLYCPNRAPAPAVCQIVQANLREIGLHVDIRLEPRAGYYDWTRRGEPFDLMLTYWNVEHFDPNDFAFLVDGSTIGPVNNVNLSYFNHPGYARKLERARRLTGAARYSAFSDFEVDVMRNAAPIATYGTPNDRHYVSARTGCYHHHPVYGFDLPAICLRR